MDNLNATSLNGASRAVPRESSDELCDTAGWQVAVAATVKSNNPQHPAAAGPTIASTSTSAPTGSAIGRNAAPGRIEPAGLPPGPLSAADYEKVGARNRYLAGKYDADSWADRALDVFTDAMKDPANVLTASERSEHQALSAKIVETIYPQPSAEAARLDAMASSPIGTIAWLATREAGGSPRAQDLAFGLGQVAGLAALVYGARAGLTFLAAQTEPSEAAIAAEAAKARNGATVAAGSKADEIETLVNSSGGRRDVEVPRRPGQRREDGGSAPPIIGSGRTAGKAPGEIRLDTPDRIQATEPTPDGKGWLKWQLFDAESGAKFGDVDVSIHDPAHPGPPLVYLNRKVAELGTGFVTLKADFSFTTASLRIVQSKWEQIFGRPLEDFGGPVLDENLSNFQVEFARIRTANVNLTPQQIGDRAIREVSFGKGRIQIGFGDLRVEMDGYGRVDIKKGPYQDRHVENVPTLVRVSAKRTPGWGGKP
jgi:hypothetical protein